MRRCPRRSHTLCKGAKDVSPQVAYSANACKHFDEVNSTANSEPLPSNDSQIAMGNSDDFG